MLKNIIHKIIYICDIHSVQGADLNLVCPFNSHVRFIITVRLSVSVNNNEVQI